MRKMLNQINKFMRDEEGQGMVEYGLIIALVAIGLITAITLLKDDLVKIFGKVSTTLGNSVAPAPAAP